MQFIVKYFPEITIKSKPVRRTFCQQLRTNLTRQLKEVDPGIFVQKQWDKLIVRSKLNDELTNRNIVDILQRTSGIAYFLDVIEYPLVDMQDVFERTKALHEHAITDKTFAVRCKRVGTHDFSSGDVERFVGGGMLEHCESKGVSLRDPDVTLRLEIREDRLYIVNQRYKGLGGLPMGSIDTVLSLMSGGFDSTVASYLTMRRGLRTHFLFFNLGGHAHEVGVKEVALFLWQKYGALHRVQFITVPFEDVVAEILNSVDDSQMGVVLKRMMLRVGSQIAQDQEIDALVTGESVAQVSSQTLRNLAVIDSVTDTFVMRPLVTMDKEQIIKIADEIGTREFAANMPEYCGVISVKPTTKAKPERIKAQEDKFDFKVLEAAIANTKFARISEIDLAAERGPDVEVLPIPVSESVIIDVRHPSEQELNPLVLNSNAVLDVPFYELHNHFATLDKNTVYMLYCDKGVMSRLHASHLKEQGFDNVSVYRPNY
jgi:thiamine biosynthesis protein ThiI